MRLRVVVRGRVQGVGFRWFVQQSADSLGLAGWVRNTPHGSVELEAEGSAPEVEQLRAMLREGPPRARVEAVDEIEVGSDQLERPFRIRR
jgi:acylphosphatase